MKILKSSSPFDIIIDKHPLFEVINKKLLKDVEKSDFSNPSPSVVTGQMSKYGTDSKTIRRLTDWITFLLNKHYGFDETERLTFYNCWFIKYKRGEETFSHHHSPSVFSFVYYIQTPKGSAPMIFTHSGKRIKAEEGKVVIFPGYVKHHAPKSRCDDRIVLSGNCAHIPKLPDHQAINIEE